MDKFRLSENPHRFLIRIPGQIGKVKNTLYFSCGAVRVISGNRHRKRKVVFPLAADNMKTSLLGIAFCQTFTVKDKSLYHCFSLKFRAVTFHSGTGGANHALNRHIPGALYPEFAGIICSFHHFQVQFLLGKLKNGRIASAYSCRQFL